MSFLKNISSALASIGKQKRKNYLENITDDENRSEELEGDKIGASKEGQLNVGIQELSDYLFLETFILSNVIIKTFNGAKLTFISENDEFILVSDTQEIKSDLAGNSFKYVTQISFDITEEGVERIKNGGFSKIKLDFKRKSLLFNKTI
ncbi:MAG: hypothetical protein CMC65_03875 [Flavobacteriaceae bacterium]|jgi:hypothetical protein|nr:hypothetical protein [Flavobacteriaceae bacterium]MDG1329665.1 hypothetical protein [Flavobacteriaceae bacterium]|tara:strand:+ start:16784 stop:17230 length:447 start_codon:yes stop_codon:yes gene_type:complete